MTFLIPKYSDNYDRIFRKKLEWEDEIKQEEDYKISSGSLNLDLAMDGGLGCGIHRLTGVNEGGKTSCALAFARHFQKHFGDKGKVIYFKTV